MIAGDLEIRLRADIARLQRDMDDARRVVSAATASMERAAQAAKAAFGGILSGLGGRELIQMTDQYTKFTSQLKLATESQREYAAAYADVKRIATTAQADLGSTGVLYARIANGTRELGVAQKEVAKITETVNLALKVSGATFEESQSAMLQLSQAFASGTLRGEEFNAVNEAAPRLMDALADGMGVAKGALKKMAEEGEITSKIMSDVLPKALADLREEAKQVQTIAGGFTLLKNEALEFVGVQAHANGVVAAATGGLALLANNLTLVAGSVMTLGAAKLGSVIGEWVASTYRQVAAASALRAANIASAEAEVAATGAKLAQLSGAQAMIVVAREEAAAKLVSSNASIAGARAAISAAQAAGAQSFALRTVRLATAELAVAEAARSAMLAELAILGRQQAAVSAQLTAATAAQAAAQAGLNAATTAGIGAAGIASRALGFLGGPIGIVISLLGIGAAAWLNWKSKAVESEKEVARTLAEETEDYIANLQRQIDKLNERNELAGKRMTSGAEPATDYEKRREAIMAEINRISKDADLGVDAKTEMLRVWGGRLNQLTTDMEKLSVAQQKNKDITFDAKYADWLGKNGTAAQKEAYELAELRKEYGRITPEMEKWVKAKYADKGAAQAIRQEATAYQNLMTSIREKIASNQLELQGYDKLSESQKMTIKLDAEIDTGKNKLSADSIKKARADIEQVAAQEKLLKTQERAKKVQEDTQKAVEESIGRNADTLLQLQERARGLELEIELHGKTAEAAVYAEAAKVRATASSLAISEEYRAELIKQAEQLEKIAGLQGRKDALDASTKAAKQAAEDWKRAAESIEQSLTDALLRGFESGKSIGQNLVDTLKNMFSTLVLRPVIQAAIQPMTNQITGFMQGGSGSAAGVTQMAGGLSSLFGGSGVGAGATSTGGASSMLGGAAGYAGWIAMGMAVADGLYKKGWDPNNGTIQKKDMLHPLVGESLLFNKIFRGIGISDRWASVLSGASLVTRLFGRKNPEIESQGFQGTVSASGFSGESYANILEKGGLFRSDKRYTKTAALGAEQDAGFDATIKAMIDATRGFASILGIEADAIDGYSKQIKLQLSEDEAKNQEAIAKLFGEVGDELSLRLVPSLTEFKLAGETASVTLQRLAGDYATIEQALWSIGMSFGAVGTASLEARERLLAAAGGLEAFAANTAGFMQNFLSEAERNAPVLKMVTEELAAMGLSAIDTREEFKQTVLGLDLTTEAGAKQYGALMSLQAAFAQVYPSTEAVTAALAEQEEAARRAAEATQQAAEAARQAAIQATKDRAANLLSGVDSMFSALQSVVSREKSLLEQSANAHRELSQALRGTLDSMSAAGQGIEDRQSARAQIQAALAIAKAGGVLPDADSLKGALSVLSKDASSMFATQQDYLRDFYSTQNDIAALAGLTDDALSVEEKSLKALDGILESAQQQINALKGIDYSVLTLAQAISGFDRSLGAAKADPVASAGGSIANLYRELLGRPADSAGLDYWQNAVAGGLSLDQVRKMIMEGAEYKGLRGFAVGTNYVPTNMPAMIHEGERIIPAADNRELMRRLSSPNEGNAALVAEIRALRTEVAGLKNAAGRTADAAEKTAGSTGQLAEQFDNATDGGNAMRADVFNVVRTKEVA